MLRMLNDIDSWFVNYPYSQGMQGWEFMRSETIVQTVANTALNGSISSGATSLVLDSATNFDDPANADVGAGYIRTGNYIYDIFTYEDKSSNTLSTVSGIQFAHTDDSEVHKMYKLPSDFGKPRALFRQSNNYEYLYIDGDFSQVPRSNTYSIKILTSTNGYRGSFLLFREDIGSLQFKLQYVKAPTSISATSSIVDAPDGTPRRVLIEKMKEYVWNVLGEENDAAVASQRANNMIQQAMAEWSTPTLQTNRSLRLAF